MNNTDIILEIVGLFLEIIFPDNHLLKLMKVFVKILIRLKHYQKKDDND